jgi:hypothetical protein
VCTRAKRLLSIPKSLVGLLQDLDVLHLWIQARKVKAELQAGLAKEPKSAGLIVLGLKKPLPPHDVANLYQDLVQPLRAENYLKESELIVDTMLPDDANPDEIQETYVKMEEEIETHLKEEGVNSRKRKSTGSTDTFTSRANREESSSPIEMAPAFNDGNLKILQNALLLVSLLFHHHHFIMDDGPNGVDRVEALLGCSKTDFFSQPFTTDLVASIPMNYSLDRWKESLGECKFQDLFQLKEEPLVDPRHLVKSSSRTLEISSYTPSSTVRLPSITWAEWSNTE